MAYYYYVNKRGERKGPILLKDIEAGEIQPETLVWCKGMPSWQRAKAVDDFTSILSLVPSGAPAIHEEEKAERNTGLNTIVGTLPSNQMSAAAHAPTAKAPAASTPAPAASTPAPAPNSEALSDSDADIDEEKSNLYSRLAWIVGGAVVVILIVISYFAMCSDDSYPIESESTYTNYGEVANDANDYENVIVEEFITEMYNNRLFEDYDFIEAHCSQSLLDKLAADYDYDDQGYAVWNFRTGYQGGINDESSIISVEPLGDGWYSYKFYDMGLKGENYLKCHIENGEVIMDDVKQISA